MYLLRAPLNGTVRYKPFFKVGLGAKPLPRHARRLQKCLGVRQHFPKKECLRRQTINSSEVACGLRRSGTRRHDIDAAFPVPMLCSLDRCSKTTRPSHIDRSLLRVTRSASVTNREARSRCKRSLLLSRTK